MKKTLRKRTPKNLTAGHTVELLAIRFRFFIFHFSFFI